MVSWLKVRLFVSMYPVHTLLCNVGQDVLCSSMEAALCCLQILVPWSYFGMTDNLFGFHISE